MISVPDGTLIRKSVQKLCVQGICFLKVYMNSYYTTFKPFLRYKPFDSSLVSLNLQHSGIKGNDGEDGVLFARAFCKIITARLLAKDCT